MPGPASSPPELMPILSRGKHRNSRKGACFMEMASVLAGEKWSDHPNCTHPLLADLARHVNDATSDDNRHQLAVLIPEVVGLNSDDLRVDARIALRCATTALPVAARGAAERARRVGAHRRLRARRPRGPAGRRPRAGESRRPGVGAAGRDLGARVRTPGGGVTEKGFRRHAGPGTVRLSIHGIAEACVPDPDADPPPAARRRHRRLHRAVRAVERRGVDPRPAVRDAHARRGLTHCAGSCTSTSTSSSPPSRSSVALSCAASPSWSAVTATRPSAASSAPRPTRRGSTACTPASRCGPPRGGCPDAVFLPVDKEAYDAASAEVMAALRSFGQPVDVLGWDEAFLGVDTDDPEALARDVQAGSASATALECSVGIGQNTLAGQAGHRLRQAGRCLPDHLRQLVRRARRPADRRAVGHRPQAVQPARRGRHQHRQGAGGRRPGVAQGARSARPPGRGWSAWATATAARRSPARRTSRAARAGRPPSRPNLDDWDEVRRQLAAALRAGRRRHRRRAARRRSGSSVKVRFAPFFTSTHGQKLEQPSTDAADIARAPPWPRWRSSPTAGRSA